MVTRKSGQFIDPKLGAVEGNFMDVTGALIGRDPNTGALKYGPGSVLSGKNVISGFGTNSYAKALDNYIDKVTNKLDKLFLDLASFLGVVFNFGIGLYAYQIIREFGYTSLPLFEPMGISLISNYSN